MRNFFITSPLEQSEVVYLASFNINLFDINISLTNFVLFAISFAALSLGRYFSDLFIPTLIAHFRSFKGLIYSFISLLFFFCKYLPLKSLNFGLIAIFILPILINLTFLILNFLINIHLHEFLFFFASSEDIHFSDICSFEFDLVFNSDSIGSSTVPTSSPEDIDQYHADPDLEYTNEQEIAFIREYNKNHEQLSTELNSLKERLEPQVDAVNKTVDQINNLKGITEDSSTLKESLTPKVNAVNKTLSEIKDLELEITKKCGDASYTPYKFEGIKKL